MAHARPLLLVSVLGLALVSGALRGADAPSTRGAPLALPDRGIWSDLDPHVRLAVPPWVAADRTEVVVDKGRRTLTLVFDGTPVKTYPIALGFAPVGAKEREGDGRTPEGTYPLVELLPSPDPARYGARSLLLGYPGPADAARGLSGGLVDATVAARIHQAARDGSVPPQDTPLGSSIRIHGGGVGKDWTLGCIALRDEDVVELYRHVRVGTLVHVLAADRHLAHDRDRDGIPDQVDIAIGAKKNALNAAPYIGGYETLAFPGGDVDRQKGVCTDVVVRALRNAGLDLQEALQQDIRARRGAYRSVVRKPNGSIDHRRVKTIIIWFRKHWQVLGNAVDPARPQDWRPGDVVFLDTFPNRAGPDHVGVLSDRLNGAGFPLVVNAWTDGWVTQEMDLLGAIPVTDHVRVR